MYLEMMAGDILRWWDFCDTVTIAVPTHVIAGWPIEYDGAYLVYALNLYVTPVLINYQTRAKFIAISNHHISVNTVTDAMREFVQ